MEELFDQTEKYDEMLNQGISLSGEDKFYFIAGRVDHMISQLPADLKVERVLDFGCSAGDTTAFLSTRFPDAEIVGADISEESIKVAQHKYATDKVRFQLVKDLDPGQKFDLCYTNGTFHHIPPEERVAVLKNIHSLLRKGGCFALFENNPWNPGTRMVMSRIPFDRDAQTLSYLTAQKTMKAGGFSKQITKRFLFYFPKSLAIFRPVERWFEWLPLGAQYYVLAVK